MGRVNTLRIADRIYLLAHGTGGTAHLAAEQVPGGRAAFLDDDSEPRDDNGAGSLLGLGRSRPG